MCGMRFDPAGGASGGGDDGGVDGESGGAGLAFAFSVNDTLHWQFMEMDMDKLFIDFLTLARGTDAAL